MRYSSQSLDLLTRHTTRMAAANHAWQSQKLDNPCNTSNLLVASSMHATHQIKLWAACLRSCAAIDTSRYWPFFRASSLYHTFPQVLLRQSAKSRSATKKGDVLKNC